MTTGEIEEYAEALTETVLKLSKEHASRSLIKDNIKSCLDSAIKSEREACRQVALGVEKQSSSLEKAAPAPVTGLQGKEYYRGRGLGAALIAQRIRSRS